MRRPASANRRLRSACVATMVPLPGSARPSASVRQFIEFAVNIPEQDSAGGACGALHLAGELVGDARVGGGHHRVHQVHGAHQVALLHLACLHGPAGNEDRRNVEAQRRHQHSGRNLVAIGDADQRVGAVGIHHVLDAVGDQFPRGQAVQHAAMTHGDAVIDGDRVELLGDSARALDLSGDELSEVLQVDVSGYELRERIGHRDDRFAEVPVLHSSGAPQAARAGHIAAMSGGARAINRHVRYLFTIPAQPALPLLALTSALSASPR